MGTFGFKEAVEFFNSELTRVNQFWTFYSVVALAVVGYTITKTREEQPIQNRVVLSVAFLLFALFNLNAICSVQQVLLSLTDAFHRPAGHGGAPTEFARAFQAVEVSPVPGVIVFHLVLDAGVIAAVWVPVGLRKLRRDRAIQPENV